jgi:acetylornithine deacetylase/succinyl-diaminopimelate desuccinylase-like protein
MSADAVADRTSDASDALLEIDSFLDRTRDERLADYLDFLRIPSIGTLHAHDADTRAAADFLVERLRNMGFENVEASPTGGHPIVYADWLHAPGAPTVLVYTHYDVQPVDPLDLWLRPPFDPVVENGRVFARGAADDKSHAHLHLWAARAWLETQGLLPVNLRIVFEGEEESGSDHFEPWIRANLHRLDADLAMISDTGFFEGNKPAITVGLRGLVYMQINVTGSKLDLHSGSFGGNVQNPANALATIIAKLKNADGSVAVPAFYDEVRELTEQERSEMERLSFDEVEFKELHGINEVWGEPSHTIAERRGARPTLDVNGIWGGFQGEGSKTIIPAEAHAKISSRLVPDMDPQKTFERIRDYVASIAPEGVTVEVKKINDGMWSRTPVEHPFVQIAADCLEEVFGVRPYYLYEGGSVPAGATFSEVLGLPVLLLGFTQPDDQAHAPNESMRLDNYEGGLRTLIRYWQRLGERPAG